MTALNTVDIPNTIDTVEKLVVWGHTVLAHLYPTVTVQETTNQAPRRCAINMYESTVNNPPQWQHIGRHNIEMDDDWQKTGKLWEHAQQIGTDAIPNEFKS